MQFEPCTLEDVRDALAFIDPEERATWVDMAFAIKAEFGDAGFDAWELWSQGGSTYKARDALSVWKSARVKSGGIGIGTLFKLARENGYRGKERTPEEKARIEAETAERRDRREQEQAVEDRRSAVMQRALSDMCGDLWVNHLQPSGTSRYLGQKRVGAYGIRFGGASVVAVAWPDTQRWRIISDRAELTTFWAENKQYDRDTNPAPYSFRHIKRGTIAVPLRDGVGTLWSLQLIYPTGKKSFFRDARKQGLFHVLGLLPGTPQRLWFAEGYSTAASIHMAMKEPAIMTIDSGNMPAVARVLREILPDCEMVFAADNDPAVKGNPGFTKAREAALAVRGTVVVPDFSRVAA